MTLNLAELKKLAEAAPKETWEFVVGDDGCPLVVSTGDVICWPDPNHTQPDDADMKRLALIAASRTALPALVAEVERKDEALKEAEAFIASKFIQCDEPCHAHSGNMCPVCESDGCIRMKLEMIRAALGGKHE